ncbi:MAG: ribosomal protein S18-alanine N-acetyltransferase [Chloroflexi bacterium]|nr:ribosomal protein S18-alanine N-acetyltransferase [Chloroflexota bacterium]
MRPMEVRDIPAVSGIEKLSFATPWPASAYKREIEKNRLAYYAVAERTSLAGDTRREPRFEVVHALQAESDGVLTRLARRFLGDAPKYDPEDAAQLEIIVGYAGLWLMADSAHVTTIAVDPPYRGEGIGELLLVALIDRSIEMGAAEVTLECRVSNYVAQTLYRKYTFRNSGLRKRYYSDDGEDAVIMTTDSLGSPTFQLVLAQGRARLAQRIGGHGPLHQG